MLCLLHDARLTSIPSIVAVTPILKDTAPIFKKTLACAGLHTVMPSHLLDACWNVRLQSRLL